MRLLILVLLLVGCTEKLIVQEDIPVSYPAKPKPVVLAQGLSWSIKDTGEICLPVKGGVALNLQIKDTIRYIKDLHTRLCYLGDQKYCKEPQNEL